MIKTGNRSFWMAQLIGWAIFGLTNIAVQGAADFPVKLMVFNTTFSIMSGVIVTSIYRLLIYRTNWLSWKIVPLLIFIAGTTFLLAIGWLIVNALLFQIFVPGFQIGIREILPNLINGGLIFLIWNLIYFFFQYFYKYQLSEIKNLKLAIEMKEAQLGTMKAQVKPHFVFNTLNNIKALILEDPHKAREMLMNFSELFRYALVHSKEELVLVSEEVEIIRQYLELMSIQYEDRMTYDIQVDENAKDEKLPPMILQLLVENGIKHGIALSEHGGKLMVEIGKRAGHIYVEVKNTGSLDKKADVETSLGTGLKNIRERLRLIYGEEAKLNLFEHAPYVMASVQLPTTI